MTDLEKKISKLIKCIEMGCDNNGTSRGLDGEPEQCQFCFEYRFPLVTVISELIKSRDERLIKELKQVEWLNMNWEWQEKTIDKIFAEIDKGVGNDVG